MAAETWSSARKAMITEMGIYAKRPSPEMGSLRPPQITNHLSLLFTRANGRVQVFLSQIELGKQFGQLPWAHPSCWQMSMGMWRKSETRFTTIQYAPIASTTTGKFSLNSPTMQLSRKRLWVIPSVWMTAISFIVIITGRTCGMEIP